jgi:hypothetical protein
MGLRINKLNWLKNCLISQIEEADQIKSRPWDINRGEWLTQQSALKASKTDHNTTEILK